MRRKVHVSSRGVRDDGEERENEGHYQESKSKVIDDASKLAQAPASRQQWLTAKTLQSDTSNRYDLGEDEGSVRDRDDGV